MELSDWINGTRNICWFSGYSWGVSDGYLMLRQVRDEGKTLRIKVSQTFRQPYDGQTIEVKCHVFAEDGEVKIHAVRIKRASLVAMPRRAALLNPLMARRGAAFDPFRSMDEIRESIKSTLRADDAVVDAIIKQANVVHGRDTGYINKLILSGFVGVKGFMQPENIGERGHVRLMLQQHEDPSRGIPIRIEGADVRYAKALQANAPINVVARAEFKTDENGRRSVEIVSDKNSIGPSGQQDYQDGKFPSWWVAMLSGTIKRINRSHGAAAHIDDAPAGAEAPQAPADQDDELLRGMGIN